MNKTYSAPKVISLKMNTAHFIAASNPKVLTDPLDPSAAEGRRANDDFDD